MQTKLPKRPPARFRFVDRIEAGAMLGAALEGQYAHRSDVLVVGLSRGGVVVASGVADRLVAPLDVVVVRKIRTPGHDELAMGALALWYDRDEVVRADRVMADTGATDEEFDRLVAAQLAEARRRAADWQLGPAPELAARTVIVVDDGLATGASMRAAIAVLRAAGAARVVIALPVAPPYQVRALGDLADEVVGVHQPNPMNAVSVHYRDFDQVPDAVVEQELLRHRH